MPTPSSSYETAFEGFERLTHTAAGFAHEVFKIGDGPAVIVIHEMPGLHPGVLAFARKIADVGLSAWCPSLFGTPGRPVSRSYIAGQLLRGLCVRREINAWAAGRSSPITEWLRDLARHAHQACGGRGVGAIGTCFTGGFALAMMTEPAVVAPVLSQPSLPLAAGPGSAARAACIDASPEEIAHARHRFETEGLSMIGLRFEGDPACPRERFDALSEALGPAFERWDIDPAEAAPGPMAHPHSVLTLNLRADGLTRAAEDRVIAFFREQTGAA